MEIKKKVPVNERIIRVLIAFGLAVLLWFMVNGNSNVIITQDYNSIPITLINSEDLVRNNLVLIEDKSYYLNLRVKGTDKNLRTIQIKEITAEVNVGDINEKGVYDLDIVVKGLSNSVIIDSMNPTTLQIGVDNIIKEDREVEIIAEGHPANDVVVIASNTSEKVVVEGPEELISQIDKMSSIVNVDGMESDTTKHLKVVALDKDGEIIDGLEVIPNVVQAEIILGKTKTIVVTPVMVGSPLSGFVVSEVVIEPSKIRIGAKEEVLESINAISIDPVDVTEKSNTFTKDVVLAALDGMYFLDGSDNVKVTVTIESVSEKSFTIDQVGVKNLSPGLVVSKIKDTSAIVKLEGASSVLNSINTNQVETFVDCSGLEPGEYEMDIKTNLSEALVKSINPQKTTIIIE
jgi:YbbR domain-containing protein